MICIPPNTHSIILKSDLVGRDHESKNDFFSLKLLATSKEVLADKLQELSLVSMAYYARSRRKIANDGDTSQEDSALPLPLLARSNLGPTAPSAGLPRKNNQFSASSPTLTHKAYERWQTATIRELDLRYMRADISEVLRITKGSPPQL